MLVEQNLAQLLVHNPNECGSDWAAGVTRTSLLSRNVHRSALAITKSKGRCWYRTISQTQKNHQSNAKEPSVKRKRTSTTLAHSNVPMNKIQIVPLQLMDS